MKQTEPKLSARDSLRAVAQTARRHTKAAFLVFLVVVYGFLAWRVVTLDRVQPTQTIVQAKLQSAGVPHVDPTVLAKIKLLQDNSVEVKTLFDQARTNPFQEN